VEKHRHVMMHRAGTRLKGCLGTTPCRCRVFIRPVCRSEPVFRSEREAVVLHPSGISCLRLQVKQCSAIVCPCLQNPKQNGRKLCRAKLITLIESTSSFTSADIKKIGSNYHIN
jgi:hypothetical protein